VFVTVALKVVFLPRLALFDFGLIFGSESLGFPVRGVGSAVDSAETDTGPSMFTSQLPVLQQPAPFQPVKLEPGSGVAPSVTSV
jgi:hypothetical protein